MFYKGILDGVVHCPLRTALRARRWGRRYRVARARDGRRTAHTEGLYALTFELLNLRSTPCLKEQMCREAETAVLRLGKRIA